MIQSFPLCFSVCSLSVSICAQHISIKINFKKSARTIVETLYWCCVVMSFRCAMQSDEISLKGTYMPSFTCSIFPLQEKKTVRYPRSQQLLRHSSSTLKPCHCSDFWAQARNIHQRGDKQPTAARYMVILCGARLAMTVLQPCCSGHDLELGGTAVPWAIALQQS